MGKINWRRVSLCGVLTGVVWVILDLLVLSLIGPDLLAAMHAVAHHTPPTKVGFVPLLAMLNFSMGVWTIWLYAAIRPRYGPGPKTAVVAGFSWWVLSSLVDTTWGSIGLIPLEALWAAMIGALPAKIVAAVVGARHYKE